MRAGGVYALEHVARRSRRDHESVMAVLSAFLRENAVSEAVPETPPPGGVLPPGPRADLHAAAVVIGRRERRYDNPERVLDLSRVVLQAAILNGADFSGCGLWDADLAKAFLPDVVIERGGLNGANLFGAFMEGGRFRGVAFNKGRLDHATLTNARFANCKFKETDISRAELQDAEFVECDLSGAMLCDADLRGAHLVNCSVEGLDLTGANLSGLRATRTDLGRATGLTAEQREAMA